MNIDVAEAIIRWDDHDDVEHFEEINKATIVSQGRWNTYYKQVYRDKRDGSYWEIEWSRGSTEQQDYDGPQDIEVNEVEPVEVTVVVYRQKVKT